MSSCALRQLLAHMGAAIAARHVCQTQPIMHTTPCSSLAAPPSALPHPDVQRWSRLPARYLLLCAQVIEQRPGVCALQQMA